MPDMTYYYRGSMQLGTSVAMLHSKVIFLMWALHKIDQCYSGWMEPYLITRSAFIQMMAVPAANGVYINLFNIGKTWRHCLQKYIHYTEKNRGPQRG